MKHFIHLYCAANDKNILARNLVRSPEVDDGCVPITVIWDAPSASVAYHDAISRATSDILVFAHQDIYFPAGWFARLRRVCESLTSKDPLWAVAGLVGMTPDWRYVGHLWDSGLGFVCGGPLALHRKLLASMKLFLLCGATQEYHLIQICLHSIFMELISSFEPGSSEKGLT